VAKHIITSNSSLPLSIKGSGDTWVIDTSASIITQQAFHETALSDAKGARDNTIIIKGAVIGGVDGDDDAVVIGGRNTRVVIGELGVVQGNAGIYFEGRHQSVANHGTITASWVGVFADHGGTIVNDGTIDAGTGIWSNSGAVKIVNQLGAEIISDGSAINVQGVGAASRIINYGTLEAYYYAVDGGELADIITNRGVMKGVITLGEGNDVFDNRGGSVDHDIDTGEGNDTLVTDNASLKMSEDTGGGKDTVRSTVTYTLNANVENLVLIGNASVGATGNELNNRLDGNSASNVIHGLAGKDRLDGHKGDDILTGGTQSDTFVFGNGYGSDAITDFEKGIDRIDLRGCDAISSFTDFKAHSTDIGTDIVLHVGKNSLHIEGVDMADLHAADFLF